jgi:hypothetical protein
VQDHFIVLHSPTITSCLDLTISSNNTHQSAALDLSAFEYDTGFGGVPTPT